MYIRRKVFSVAIDQTTGEERLFSVTDRTFSKGEKEEKNYKKIRPADNFNIKSTKLLNTKKDREAIIEAYDQEGDRNSHKLGKQAAKYGAAGGAVAGGIGANATKNELKELIAENSPKLAKLVKKNPKLAKAAIVTAGVAGGAAAGGAGSYGSARAGRAIEKKVEDLSKSASHRAQKIADTNKVASGSMSREEFALKYGRNIGESQRREFKKNEKNYSENEGGMSTGKKAAAIGAGVTGVGAAGIYGANKLGKHLEKKAENTLLKGVDEKGKQSAVAMKKMGTRLQKPAEWIAKKIARKG